MKFLAQGGLGNQLFILAEAMRLKNENPTIRLSVHLNNSKADSILKLKGQIPRMDILISKKEFLMLQVYLTLTAQSMPLQLATKFFPKIHISQNISDELKIHELSQDLTVVGFFQNSTIVERVWPTLGPLLLESLVNCRSNNKFRNEFKKYAVVHVRRGDYMANMKSFGVLSERYYDKVSRLVEFPLIVCTNDYGELQTIERTLQPKAILGPRELSAWETLELMSGARQVFAANSSLSWWGSYVAMKNGAEVFLPKPWFINETHETPSLNIQGSQSIRASFIT